MKQLLLLRTPEECGVSRPSWTTSTSTTRWTTTSSGRDGWSRWSTTRPSATSGPQYRAKTFWQFCKIFPATRRTWFALMVSPKGGTSSCPRVGRCPFSATISLLNPICPRAYLSVSGIPGGLGVGRGVDLIDVWEWFTISERIEILNIHLLIVIIISSGRHDSLRILPLIRFCQ